jgi:hypothetical protein
MEKDPEESAAPLVESLAQGKEPPLQTKMPSRFKTAKKLVLMT